jgi:predicted RNase H-like HicB family nuclease
LFLWPAEEGGYNVTSPLDPALITQGDTLEEAFAMARDAWRLLNKARQSKSEPSLDPAKTQPGDRGTEPAPTRDENEGLPLSEAQKQDLVRRLASYDGNPVPGSTWEEVKARLAGSH